MLEVLSSFIRSSRQSEISGNLVLRALASTYMMCLDNEKKAHVEFSFHSGGFMFTVWPDLSNFHGTRPSAHGKLRFWSSVSSEGGAAIDIHFNPPKFAATPEEAEEFAAEISRVANLLRYLRGSINGSLQGQDPEVLKREMEAGHRIWSGYEDELTSGHA